MCKVLIKTTPGEAWIGSPVAEINRDSVGRRINNYTKKQNSDRSLKRSFDLDPTIILIKLLITRNFDHTQPPYKETKKKKDFGNCEKRKSCCLPAFSLSPVTRNYSLQGALPIWATGGDDK